MMMLMGGFRRQLGRLINWFWLLPDRVTNWVSPNTIRNYVANGQLTAIRVGPKLLKFEVAEVDSLRQTIES